MTKTYLEKPANVQRKWYLVDAEERRSRLAAKSPPCCEASINRPLLPMSTQAIMSSLSTRRRSCSPATRWRIRPTQLTVDFPVD